MSFVEEHLTGKKALIRRVFEEGGVRFRGESGAGLCPFHDDTHPSFSANLQTSAWICHACGEKGDLVTFVEKRLGMSTAEAIAEIETRLDGGAGPTVAPPKAEKRVSRTTTYEIRGQTGELVALHVRTDKVDGKKIFNWERDGKPGLQGLPASQLPLYGSELVDQRRSEPIYVTEGEKAADALRAKGILAVGTVTGASTVPADSSLEVLKGRDVILWPDNDGPGKNHMTKIGERLHAMAAHLRVLSIEGAEGDDAFDFFASGKAKDELVEAVAAAPDWAATHTEASPPSLSAEQSTGFPEDAWWGPFATWRDLFSPCTEASLEFLWASFLVTAGLVLDRSVWVSNPRPLYPNFYVLLTGPTGDSHKSTVLYLARELMDSAREDVEVLTGIVSSEGIYERLSKREGTVALIYVDELASLSTVANRKGTGDIFPKLNSLYYCPRQDTLDRRKDPTILTNPFLSLIAAAPTSQLADLLGNTDISGGTLNRYLIVAGDAQDPKPRPPALAAGVFGKAAQPLKAIARIFHDRCCEMKFSSDAAALFDRFYRAWKNRRSNGSGSDLTSRTHEHVLKIAMVYSALEGARELTEGSMAIAIKLGGWLESNALRLLGDVGKDKLSLAEQRITKEVRSAGGKILTRSLQQRLSRAVGSDFNRALRNLKDADVLGAEDVKTLAGQTEKWVVLKTTPNSYLPHSTGRKVFGVGSVDPFAVASGFLAAKSAGTGHPIEAYETSGGSPPAAPLACSYHCGLPSSVCTRCHQPFSAHPSSGRGVD